MQFISNWKERLRVQLNWIFIEKSLSSIEIHFLKMQMIDLATKQY